MMNEFIGKFEEAINANDPQEAELLAAQFVYPVFLKSLFKELAGTAYFPDLNPDFSENFDHEKPLDELHKEAVIRIQNNPDLMVLSSIEEDAISEITCCEFITLFEAALLIGQRIEKDPKLLVPSCPDMFFDAIIKKQIDPREPLTHIPYSKLHKSPSVIGWEIFFQRPVPDLSWQLTLKEAAEFAILKGYPESAFSDLLSEQPTEEPQVTTKNNNAIEMKEGEWKTKNEREFSYHTIGALVLLLIEKTNGQQFGSRNEPTKSGIYNAIGQLLEDMGFKTEGQTKSTLNN